MNILIIGATSGIGHELWRHYVSDGHQVAVTGRRNDILNGMSREYPQNTYAEQCDIADAESFDVVLENVVSRFRQLDLAIICAGIGELNPELALPTELSTLSVNIMGWTNAVCSIYKVFERQRFGHLVTVTSVGGLQPTPAAPAYSASKAFQINYTKSLQKKSTRTSVVVTEIRPGLTDTRMAKGEGLFWVMPLPKVTAQIIKAIERKSKCYIVTKRWRVINFMLKHL